MSSLASRLKGAALAMLGVAALFGAAGCSTQAFCFDNCDGDSSATPSTSKGSGPGSGGAGGGCIFNCGPGGGMSNSSSSGSCMETNGGIEICDKIDNDCNGTVDDLPPPFDLNDPKTCGTCDTNCYKLPTNWDPATVKCAPSPMPGQVPGTCSGTCAQDYYDTDGNGSCEYYCVKTAPDDKTCNNKDDDCFNGKDDGVDYCDLANCGKCGNNCVVLHGTPACTVNGMP